MASRTFKFETLRECPDGRDPDTLHLIEILYSSVSDILIISDSDKALSFDLSDASKLAGIFTRIAQLRLQEIEDGNQFMVPAS